MPPTDKEKSQKIQDKYQAILTTMLRDDDNKYCIDCDAKGPRWASWNLGIFMCIRCAGIHRNLGVHISKVKSVNLDTWTAEQIASVQAMGNSKGRAVYEANLPDNFRRPQTDSALEQFIRSKYEQRKWIAKEWIPPNITISPDLTDEESTKDKRKQIPKVETEKKTPKATSTPTVIANPAQATKTVKQQTVAPVRKAEPEPVIDLLGMNDDAPTVTHQSAATNDLQSDFFGPFVSQPFNNDLVSVDAAPLQPPATAQNHTNTQLLNDVNVGTTAAPTTPTAVPKNDDFESLLSQTAVNNGSKTRLDKDSILALYSKTTAQPQAQAPTNVPMPQAQAQMPQNGMFMPQMNQFPGAVQGMTPQMQQQFGMNMMAQQQPQQMFNPTANMQQMQFNQMPPNAQMQNLQMQMGNMTMNPNTAAAQQAWIQQQQQARLPQNWQAQQMQQPFNPMQQQNPAAAAAAAQAAAQANLFNFSTNGNTLSSNLWQ